jgi:hypothetical protein
MFGGKSSIGTGLFRCTSDFPVSTVSPKLSTHLCVIWLVYNCPFKTCSATQRQCYPTKSIKHPNDKNLTLNHDCTGIVSWGKAWFTKCTPAACSPKILIVTYEAIWFRNLQVHNTHLNQSEDIKRHNIRRHYSSYAGYIYCFKVTVSMYQIAMCYIPIYINPNIYRSDKPETPNLLFPRLLRRNKICAVDTTLLINLGPTYAELLVLLSSE